MCLKVKKAIHDKEGSSQVMCHLSLRSQKEMVVSHSCVSSSLSQLYKLVPVHEIEVFDYVAGFPCCSCTVEESIDYVLSLLLFPLLKVILVALLLSN